MVHPTTGLRESVIVARCLLAEGRGKLQRQHASGSRGIQVCAGLADLMDSVVQGVFESAINDLTDGVPERLVRHLALLPHGGYGRRDVAPYSDVDLLLLYDPRYTDQVALLARRLLTDLSDVGLAVGFSSRTPKEAWQLAWKDAVIFTSQAESRFLAGNEALFTRFLSSFRRKARRHCGPILRSVEQARSAERTQFGETVFLLEPNVKRSRGGLRDIQLLRWVGFARYGENDPEALALQNVLSKDDFRTIRKAQEFLLHLRNELHFHSGTPQDILYRSEQERIATAWDYEGTKSFLSVERFMTDYFDHTSNVQYVVEHFLSSARVGSMLATFGEHLMTHRYEGHFRVGPVHVGMRRKEYYRLRGDLGEVLRLMDLANLTDRWIDHETWKTIRTDMASRPHIEITSKVATMFMSLLSHTPRLGDLLRRLHELRVLEKLVVGMQHARCRLQFNRYHKFTVDEHCLQAVERATEFQDLSDSMLGTVYRQIKRRNLLHLALLTHDLGKGFEEDHSEVGVRLVRETAKNLSLPTSDAETLEFLVQKHLMMSHLAFRRDTSDPRTVLRFASDVGSQERLKMLYVLACADLAAIGPDVLNRWKIDVLSSLYARTMQHLTGETIPGSIPQVTEARRCEVGQLAPQEDAGWYAKHVEALPGAFITHRTAAEIMKELQRLRTLPPGKAIAWGRYLPERDVTEYAIGVHEDLVSGAFHRLTGCLTAQGLRIYSAEIHSLPDSLILDHFIVDDLDYERAPLDRVRAVCRSLRAVLESPTDAPPVFRNIWKSSTDSSPLVSEQMETQVVVDNATSPQCTIIDVFTHDRVGLLYSITRTLYELEIFVQSARIDTYLDQVVDVFYVTDLDGRKLTDESRIGEIRRQLRSAIDDHLSSDEAG